ncbi:hypothetical protein TSMEX_005529 [Taenia solium]|eukprot:TsM_000706800 transcript=TsM_000706800 gene=TsM_000706800
MQELIERYEWRKRIISQLTLGSLLSMRDVLKGVSALAKRIYDRVDGYGERINLHVDYSLSEALMTLSLIHVADQEETGHQSSCQGEAIIFNASESKQIIVGGIPATANAALLREHYGTVISSFLSLCKQFAYAIFENEESVRKAISRRTQFIWCADVEMKGRITKRKKNVFCHVVLSHESRCCFADMWFFVDDTVFIWFMAAGVIWDSFRNLYG